MYSTVSGKNEGSTYFSFVEMGQLFEKSDFSKSDGDIDNLFDPLNGWRLPTHTEWGAIIGTTRDGSTVNDESGKHYAGIKLTDVSHAGSLTPLGLLVFPDGNTITGKELDGIDDTLMNSTSLTISELNGYLSQGCVFLPASGYHYNGGIWSGCGSMGCYWSCSCYDDAMSPDQYAYCPAFYNMTLLINAQDGKDSKYCSIRLIKPVE